MICLSAHESQWRLLSKRELPHLNWCTALVGIQHTTLQRQWSWFFIHYLVAWNNDCSRFWRRIKEKSFRFWFILTNPSPTSNQGEPLFKGHLLWSRGCPFKRGSNVCRPLEKEKGGHCILLGTENWWLSQFLVNKLCYPWGPPAILSCL